MATLFRSLRHRNYRLFLSGQLISLIGTWMQSVAQSWLVYRLTGSAVLLGSVGFAGQIPVFLLAPVGGVVADRFDRRRLVIATQVASMTTAALLAALTLTGAVEIWHVMMIAAALGVVNAFDIPARQSFLLEMVTREDLPNAIALNSSMFNGARIVGPAVAGLLVAGIGEGWCFFANAVSYVAVLIGLFRMRIDRRAPPAAATSTLDRIREGFQFVVRTRAVWVLLVLLGIISITGVPYSVLMPVFASDILHGGASSLGLLMSSTGLGALTGALVLARRSGFRGLGRLVAIAAIGFGVSLIAFSFSRDLMLSVVLLFPVGACLMLQMAASNTLIQAMVPDHLRGRVMSVYSMMFMGMAPFGALLAGSGASWIGAPWVVFAGGIVSVVAGLAFAYALPHVRVQARQLILEQQSVAGEPAEETTSGFSVPRN